MPTRYKHSTNAKSLGLMVDIGVDRRWDRAAVEDCRGFFLDLEAVLPFFPRSQSCGRRIAQTEFPTIYLNSLFNTTLGNCCTSRIFQRATNKQMFAQGTLKLVADQLSSTPNERDDVCHEKSPVVALRTRE
jgi:hypothetical protein